MPVKEKPDSCPQTSSPNESSSREASQKQPPSSQPQLQLQAETSNGLSHHKQHSSSCLRHHHHHYVKHSVSGEHLHNTHWHTDDTDSSGGVQAGMLPPLPPSDSADGTNAPRELLVLSPTKILIRDPIKSTVKRKCVGHCGVQVNLKRRTESKEIQTSISGMSLGQLDPKNNVSVEQTSLSGKLSAPSDQKKPCTDRDHPKAAASLPSSSLPKMVASRSSQPSSGWKKDKSHGASSRHGQQDASHSSGSASSGSRFFTDSEPIPDCFRVAHGRYRKYVRLEKYPNGGALVAHAYHHELQHLSEKEREDFADQFLELVYKEMTDGAAHCVMGIVHDAASPMEDFIDYFSVRHPSQPVKMGVLGKSDIVSTTMEKYQEDMLKNYSQGTFRWGPLLQISLVGIVSEEVRVVFHLYLRKCSLFFFPTDDIFK